MNKLMTKVAVFVVALVAVVSVQAQTLDVVLTPGSGANAYISYDRAYAALNAQGMLDYGAPIFASVDRAAGVVYLSTLGEVTATVPLNNGNPDPNRELFRN